MIFVFDFKTLDSSNFAAVYAFSLDVDRFANPFLTNLREVLQTELKRRTGGIVPFRRRIELNVDVLTDAQLIEAMGVIGGAGVRFAAQGKLLAANFCSALIKAVTVEVDRLRAPTEGEKKVFH